MEVHTYIEVSGTVKAILIGHHTEREGERRQERKGKEGDSTKERWWRGKRKKKNKKKGGVMRHRVADGRNSRWE